MKTGKKPTIVEMAGLAVIIILLLVGVRSCTIAEKALRNQPTRDRIASTHSRSIKAERRLVAGMSSINADKIFVIPPFLRNWPTILSRLENFQENNADDPMEAAFNATDDWTVRNLRGTVKTPNGVDWGNDSQEELIQAQEEEDHLRKAMEVEESKGDAVREMINHLVPTDGSVECTLLGLGPSEDQAQEEAEDHLTKALESLDAEEWKEILAEIERQGNESFDEYLVRMDRISEKDREDPN
jgi:hypothetical protein